MRMYYNLSYLRTQGVRVKVSRVAVGISQYREECAVTIGGNVHRYNSGNIFVTWSKDIQDQLLALGAVGRPINFRGGKCAVTSNN